MKSSSRDSKSIMPLPTLPMPVEKIPKTTSQNVIKKPPSWRTRRSYSHQITRYLVSWINSHRDFPYASTSDRNLLMRQTGLNKTQLLNWLANARRRLLKRQEFSLKAKKRDEDTYKTFCNEWQMDYPEDGLKDDSQLSPFSFDDDDDDDAAHSEEDSSSSSSSSSSSLSSSSSSSSFLEDSPPATKPYYPPLAPKSSPGSRQQFLQQQQHQQEHARQLLLQQQFAQQQQAAHIYSHFQQQQQRHHLLHQAPPMFQQGFMNSSHLIHSQQGVNFVPIYPWPAAAAAAAAAAASLAGEGAGGKAISGPRSSSSSGSSSPSPSPSPLNFTTSFSESTIASSSSSLFSDQAEAVIALASPTATSTTTTTTTTTKTIAASSLKKPLANKAAAVVSPSVAVTAQVSFSVVQPTSNLFTSKSSFKQWNSLVSVVDSDPAFSSSSSSSSSICEAPTTPTPEPMSLEDSKKNALSFLLN